MFPLKSTVPTRHQPFVVWGLIAANVFVFLIQEGMSEGALAAFLSRFALIPARYFAGEGLASRLLQPMSYLPLVSNAFLHGGWLHLILNMWTLWLFGPAVEDRLGSARFLLFYLACSVLASLTYVYFDPASTVPALGASGAIAGVLGSYTVMFPWSHVVVLVPVLFLPLFFALPAVVFTGLWFLVQLLSGTAQLFAGGEEEAGIAWWAHVGGFLAGMALTPLLRRAAGTYRDYAGDEVVLGFRPRGWR
jgi:membrane associated rhomboid family serine protease